jgi:sugar lactone lactonase YvrE
MKRLVVAVILLFLAVSGEAQLRTVTTYAGPRGVKAAVDGEGSAPRFTRPLALATDRQGNVYVADGEDDTIRKITPAGAVTTLAGFEGVSGSADGAAGNATFRSPGGIAVDAVGNVYVADTFNDSIRKISPAGLVTTMATDIDHPTAIAVDDRGNVFTNDRDKGLILRIAPGGEVTTWVHVQFNPVQILLRPGGILYMTLEDGNGVYQVTLAGAVSNIANDLDQPYGLASGAAGDIYAADTGNNRICRIGPNGVQTTFAGAGKIYDYIDGTTATARFAAPTGLAIDGNGTIYVADADNHCIRRITTDGNVTTLAGAGFSRDGYVPPIDGLYPNDLAGSADGPLEQARFRSPFGLAVNSDGDLYVSDTGNHTIRRITVQGVVTTIAGKAGQMGYADGAGVDARFSYPEGIAVDAAGTLFVADAFNHVIRKISPAGVVSTLAGTPGVMGSTDGNTSIALFSYPGLLVIDAGGNLYVGESGSNRIRKITPGGVVSTLVNLQVDARSIVPEPGGNLIVTTGDNQLLRVFPNGQWQVFGRRISQPSAVALTPDGDLFVADGGLKLVVLSPLGDVFFVAGRDDVHGRTDGTGADARFGGIKDMVIAADGAIYLTDGDAVRVARPALSDVATIDIPQAPPGIVRQLGVHSATATAFEWTIIRRPVDSAVELASALPNPVFRPDVPGVYVFRLTATGTGGTSITTVSFYAEPPRVHPRAVAH